MAFDIPSSPAAFPATRLSVFERLRNGTPETRQGAFDLLARAYWRPVYKYVRLTWRLPREDAEDAVQGFFSQAHERDWLDRFDPSVARFRTFLRTCVDRFVMNELKALRAQKRGGGAVTLSLDFEGAEGELTRHEPADPVDHEELFRREFVRALFAGAVDAVREEFTRAGKLVPFLLFERYDLGPEQKVTYAELGREFGLPVTQVTNHLAAVRRRFRAIVLERLREVSGSDEEYRAEARDILGIELL